MTYNSIQLLRGGAALIVVFHHFMQIFYGFERTNIIGDFLSDFGGMGVDVFFVVSGFIMTHIVINKEKTASSFILNRLVRVVPNYWFYSVVIVVLGLIISIHSSDVTLTSFIQSLLFIPNENPSPLLGVFPTLTVGWTLNYEMLFYVIVSVALFVFKKNTKAVFILVAIVLFLIPILNKTIMSGYYRFFLIEFILGGCVYYLIKFNKKEFNLGVLILSASLLFLNLHPAFERMLISFFIVMLFVYLERFFKKEILFIKSGIFLGNISYSIYLSHTLVINILFVCFTSYRGDINSYTDISLFLFLTTLFTILISYFSYHLIELKTSRILKNTFKKYES